VGHSTGTRRCRDRRSEAVPGGEEQLARGHEGRAADHGRPRHSEGELLHDDLHALVLDHIWDAGGQIEEALKTAVR
jgi:hypothetical protein